MIPNPFDDQRSQIRIKAALTYGFLVTANVLAWLWALIIFDGNPILLGTAFLAYMFGIRHAFDADHIAAIDNIVRNLMRAGKAPYSVGFFFSLGHSTVVIVATIVIVAVAVAMQTSLNSFHDTGTLIGTSVSAFFLLTIGVANLVILQGIWIAFNRVRRGEKIVDEDLDALLAGRGLFVRLFRRIFRGIAHSWQMYPIGFLFGLGFDTTTEVGLLGISATQAAQSTSVWNILVFPVLFTAGMSLMDTTDSMMMTGAYGWAFVNPIRKLWYNLTITAASVAIALFVGVVEALQLIAEKLGFEGGFWWLVSRLNDNFANFGFVIVGIFVGSWILSTLVYRLKSFDKLEAPGGR